MKMGKRKGVKGSTKVNNNGNGQGETSILTSSTSMEMSQERNLSPDNKIRGETSSKKMKRGEASNLGVEVESGDCQSQSQESGVKEIPVNNLHSESANANKEEKLSSSSLYWTRSRKEAQDPEVKELELSSTRKKETNDSSNSPGQEEATGEGPINDLPPEMLTKILKCVDTRSLLKCRLVNLHWLEISSRILTTRTDLVLKFKDYDIKRAPINHTPPKKIKNYRLQEFVQSMKKCNNFPYASFAFNVDGPSFFEDKDWIEFLSLFAPSNPNQNPNQNQKTKIKYLQFRWYSISPKRLLLFTERLSDLLLNKIPHLEGFGLDLDSIREVKENIKLFPLPKTPEPKTAAVSASVPIQLPIQLPYLKVLKIDPDMFLYYPGIVEDLLKAAVNLTTINKEGPFWTEEVFQFLHSLGKLHVLQKVDIGVDEDYLSSLRNSTQHQHSSYLLGFKMHKLKVYSFGIDVNPPFHADASKFLSTLLESSKDTLEKLEIPPLGFLHGLQFPKFTKLRTLKAFQRDYEGNELRGSLFPPGIRSRSREMFPTVDNLNVRTKDWQSTFPQEDSIPIFSNVDTFWLNDFELQETVITKLSLMCPNLKHCTIQTWEGNPEQFNFPRVGREIWTHLNQLESLEVDLEVNLENHAFPALDSCFTGISIENCKRLSGLMETEKAKNKSKSPVKLPESEELRALTKREHPSILDMKNLKKLTVNPYSGKRKHQGKNFFTTKITWISEEFAFKLMPHLQFNGRRPSTSS